MQRRDFNHSGADLRARVAASVVFECRLLPRRERLTFLDVDYTTGGTSTYTKPVCSPGAWLRS
jgi:hypothetical protein